MGSQTQADNEGEPAGSWGGLGTGRGRKNVLTVFYCPVSKPGMHLGQLHHHLRDLLHLLRMHNKKRDSRRKLCSWVWGLLYYLNINMQLNSFYKYNLLTKPWISKLVHSNNNRDLCLHSGQGFR